MSTISLTAEAIRARRDMRRAAIAAEKEKELKRRQEKQKSEKDKIKQGLPKCMYHSHGSYYMVKNNVWTNLGKDRRVALSRYYDLLSDPFKPAPTDELAFAMTGLHKMWKRNAKRRKIDFDISADECMELLDANNRSCAVTGMPFSLALLPTSTRRPFSPSLDRIDSSKGYSRDNCRLVCTCVNFAMQEWGDDIVKRMAVYAVNKLAQSAT